MKKKTLAIILGATMALSLFAAGCSSSSQSSESTQEAEDTSSQEETASEEDTGEDTKEETAGKGLHAGI